MEYLFPIDTYLGFIYIEVGVEMASWYGVNYGSPSQILTSLFHMYLLLGSYYVALNQPIQCHRYEIGASATCFSKFQPPS